MILIEKADDLKSYLEDNFKAIFTVLMVIAGLVMGIILANNPQILKSSAATDSITISKENTTFTVNTKTPTINFDPSSFEK